MMEKPFTAGDIAVMLEMHSKGLPAEVIAEAFYDAEALDILYMLDRVMAGERESIEQRQALDDAHEESVRATYRAAGYHNIY